MTDERGVNTVADVALALLFVSAAVALLSGYTFQEADGHEPLDADRMAAVVGSSTVNVSYSVEPALEPVGSELGAEWMSTENGGEETTDTDSFRITHGSIAEQVGAAAVANLTRRDGGERLTAVGERYAAALDERVQSRLVGAQFETRIAAFWQPYDGAPFTGRVTVGVDPPPHRDVSTAEITIPSGIESVRQRALDAATSGGFDAVADTVAAAIVNGYLPQERSRYALEAGGVERTRTLYRYGRMATILDEASPDATEFRESLRRHRADPTAANEYLASELSEELVTDMAARFATPSAAARALSTGEVTLMVSTWEP